MDEQGIKAVLFDLDGTLVDTYDLILNTFKEVTRSRLGRVISDSELMQKVGQPLRVQMLDWFSPEEVDEVVEEYRVLNAQLHNEYVRAFPYARQCLLDLKALGLKLGVVTSKGEVAAKRALNDFDLFELLDVFVSAESTTRYKPEPDPLLKGCELLGLEPAQCVYIGDAPFDLMASNAAGTLSVAASWGMFPLERLSAEHPAYVLQGLAELPPLLETLK